MAVIDVLLATHRPEKDWLDAQVESIRAQEDVETNLLVREDADGAGPAANFSALLGMSKADYIAFADQDDVWMKDKLKKSLDALRGLEARWGRGTPLAVFTDAIVTDGSLNPFPGTHFARQRVDPVRGCALNRLLMQNFIPGNAMLINAALRDRAGSIPSAALMHDVWVLLTAAAFGRIGYVDEPLYLYRQHGANALGATEAGAAHAIVRAREGVSPFRARLTASVRQARAFRERFGAACPACVGALADLCDANWFVRRGRIVRHGLFKQGVLRNLALLAFA